MELARNTFIKNNMLHNESVVLKANAALRLENNPLNEQLATDECRIRIKHAGICSSDVYRGFASGAYFYPLIMGHEFAGEVEQVGKGVIDFKPGDRVVVFPLLPCFQCEACETQDYAQCVDYKYYGSRNNGAFTHFLDVKSWNMLKLPDDVSLADAALLEPMAVVVHGLKKLALDKPSERKDKLLIIGFGFLSIMFLEMLRNLHPKMQIEVVDRNAPKLEGVDSLNVITHCFTEDEQWSNFLADSNNRFELVAEMSGHPANFDRSITAAKQGAKVLWLSNITGDLTLAQKRVSQILRKEVTLIGTWNSTFKKVGDDDWQDCLKLIQEGRILPSKLVSHQITLPELPSTLEKMYKHKTKQAVFNCVKVSVSIE